MKLKFYLRGLGTGILAAALVFMAVGNPKAQSMTDSEILERAAELESRQESRGVLAESGKEAAQEPEKQTPASQQEPEKQTSASEQEPEKQTPASEQEPEKQTPASQQEPEALALNAEQETESNSQAKEEQADAPKQTTETEEEAAGQSDNAVAETITITISSGDSSETISKRVAQAGLVSSAEDYNRFLCSNGYDKKLRIGKHEVPVGATETEIANLLTGR